MELHQISNSSNASLNLTSKLPSVNGDGGPSVQNNTLTFVIGFGILILFVVFGILASAFLCFTLKKDPYLWEVERERQQQEKNGGGGGGELAVQKRDHQAADDAEMLNQECTQI